MEVDTETPQPNYDRSIDDNNDDDVNGSKSSKKEHRSIGYFELFSYATPCEYIYLLIATLAAILRSSAFPLVIVIYSEMIAMFIDRSLGTTTKTYFLPLFDGGKILFNATHEENMMELKNDAKAFGILSGLNTLSLFLMGIIYVDLYNYVALNILVRLRCKYYQHVIRQDISWHDTIDQQNFASIITDNMEKIRNGISETIGHFIQLLFDIIISIVISFVYGWRLTLTVCAYIPITMIVNYVVSKYQTKLTASEQSAYSKASSVAEEVLAAIRTVIAFGGEKHERQRYNELLVPARKAGKLKGIFSGLNDSLLKAMLFLCSAATFWHGVHLVLNDRDKDPNDKEYTPEILMIVICGIIVGAQHISYTAPFLEGFAIAKGSAIPIYNVLESRSKIDPLSSHGKILNYGLKGDIEFQDVFFHYPSRPNSIVLRGFNLKVKSGETVALVGTSGSGKSTCIQLLLRFYDPIFGKILIDDEDLRKYNVNWLRSNVAVVGQEPVLFFGTIEENIRYGKMDATQKEIEDAAKIAGAHDFIISLPESYKTSISEKGIQLSGGQRQRIAIARALIQNPKILLLDEATSALDYQSEKLIQNALDNASKGRTTIVISHRLSAICQAHRIIFIENGKIVEEGDHETLMLQKGHYYNMVATQEYEGTLRDNNTENFDLNIYNEVDVKKCDFNSVLEEQWEESKIYVGLKNNFIENELHNTKANKLDKAETEEDTTKFMRTFLRVLKWSKPEWGYLIIGTVCAALYGCTQPVFAIILAELFGSLSEKEPDEVLRQSTKTSIISTIVGVVAGITCLAQTYFFNLAGVWLTTRMRSAAFKKILKQDMAWFDEKENSVGALSARLAGDACGVQGAIGFPLSNILQALFNLICSFSIGFAYSWELALICLSTAPFMVAAILFEAKFNNKSALEEKRILEETSRIATESIAQIRTVAALRRETELIKLYKMEVMKYYRQIKGRLRFRGLVSSLGLSIMFFGYSITLTYGGYMSANGRIEFKEIIKISNSLLYGLFILAQSLAFTPAFNAALLSANRLFNIIDRKPQILSPNLKITTDFKQPRHQNNNNLTHAVDYRNIKFQYPTRPGQKVLNGFNLAIMQGKTVGLVGASGSGKSTCIQLLLRYYDPDSGQILIDNENIQLDMSLDNLRQRFGIVAQEPSLFENTIAENIAYGDNSRPVPMDEIIKAAKIANAHDFIINLPKAYETCLGARGTQLSGGQKQRIAIARALIRNPKILLLDEATSALDIQSENIVQKALDEACSGRTCLIIAHRLSTIQNADLICVIKNGHIVEQGNHTHLLNRNGIYAKLYRSQPNALTTTTKTTPPLPTSRIL